MNEKKSDYQSLQKNGSSNMLLEMIELIVSSAVFVMIISRVAVQKQVTSTRWKNESKKANKLLEVFKELGSYMQIDRTMQ